jgi:hypothetical protein
MAAKHKNDLSLSNVPLEKWTGEDLMKMSAKAARLWGGKKAFNPKIATNSLMTNLDDRAQEICLRVLARLKKDDYNRDENQENRFFRIAEYIKQGIIQDNFSPGAESLYTNHDDDVDGSDILNRLDFVKDDRRSAEDRQEAGDKIRGLFNRIGLHGRQIDFISSIFDSYNKDLINATGISESSLKAKRRQILADIKQKIKKAGLVDEFQDALAAFARARSDITISEKKGEEKVEMTLSHYSRITI